MARHRQRTVHTKSWATHASLRSLPRSDSSLERRLAEMGAKSPLGKKTKKEEAALAKEAAQQAAVAKETEGLAASAAALGQELRDQEDVVIQGILKQYEKEEERRAGALLLE